MEYSFEDVPFLNMLIKNENDQIITHISHEPTDTQNCLHFKSNALK